MTEKKIQVLRKRYDNKLQIKTKTRWETLSAQCLKSIDGKFKGVYNKGEKEIHV